MEPAIAPDASDRPDPDPRAAALAWAAGARAHRAELSRDLAAGVASLADVLAPGSGSGGVTLLFVLESLPGARKVDTRRHLDRLGIDGSLLVRDVDAVQRTALLTEFPLDAPDTSARGVEHR